jgi:TnpA family transposase
MPRRSLLTTSERAALLAFPVEEAELIRHYTFSERDLSLIRQHRGGHNRLGFAVQLCYLRFPGYALPTETIPPDFLLSFVARQLHIDPDLWSRYAQRDETRRDHLVEVQAFLGLAPFGLQHSRDFVERLTELALQTDRGIVLATALVEALRQQRIIVPSIDGIERVCAEALTRGSRRVYATLTEGLTSKQQAELDRLLEPRGDAKFSSLAWLRQSPGLPNAKHILEHLERLRAIRDLGLPDDLERSVHQNRLLKLAREGGQTTAQHLRVLEPLRRYAILVAVMLETRATLTDEIIDLHDRILGMLFNRAKRDHAEQFQHSGKAINEKVRLFYKVGQALLEAKQSGKDPFSAIEAILPWEDFTASVAEAEKLAKPEGFDFLYRLTDGYTQLRRYTPELLDTLQLKAAPAARELLAAVDTLREMNGQQVRKVPEGAPAGFVRKRWQDLVFTDQGIDRRFYELCVLAELRNALRSGDIWVQGSRQFKDFEDYLLPAERFATLQAQQALPLAVDTDGERFLQARLELLKQELQRVDQLAASEELPDATITDRGLRITPLEKAVPAEAEALMQQAYALLPHLKITELLLEVDDWTGFNRHFTHIRSGEEAPDRSLLLTAVLADALNLGLRKMAESCAGTSYARLSWLQAWHIRDETYTAALAELTNAQYQHPFACYWGDGTTSSSDGQRFRAGGPGEGTAHFNAKYGSEPGVTFYTHISDQYAPYHIKVIHAPVRDSTYVLDGLLYHESDLRIEEHYTDTAGFTDHVFALMHLLGFRFAPRIRDLGDNRMYVPGDAKAYPRLANLVGGNLNLNQISAHWDDILRLATSIKHGTVTASLMLRKLGSYPRQNGLAVALRELGRIERTLFTLEWLQSVELRRRIQVGLNKGEAKNALARAVFFNRLGEMRDRSFENQRYRASGLNLVIAAIILWNTVYLERVINELRAQGRVVNEELLQHLSPLGWEHINLTGDYTWQQSRGLLKGSYRPLRSAQRNRSHHKTLAYVFFRLVS